MKRGRVFEGMDLGNVTFEVAFFDSSAGITSGGILTPESVDSLDKQIILSDTRNYNDLSGEIRIMSRGFDVAKEVLTEGSVGGIIANKNYDRIGFYFKWRAPESDSFAPLIGLGLYDIQLLEFPPA